MFASLYPLLLLYLQFTSISAQSVPAVLCIPDQCLQGYSNTTIGVTLSSPTTSTPLKLLPGVYTSTTNPQLLHNALISSSASIATSAGFGNSSSLSLPLNLALQAGISTYSDPLYSGQAAFTALPSSPIGASTSVTGKAIGLASNVWIALNAGNSSSRFIVWDAVPDVAQLPSGFQGSLSLTDIQSTACTPGCAASGICTASGTCQCSPGFAGTSCESCASGFFGPKCQACPANCDTCDEGITGSGRCLKPTLSNDPAKCNCKNGICGANGQCTCNPGFTTGNDGTACSKCLPGFFQTSNGDCKVCQLGCNQCSDGTGACTQCQNGFGRDNNDPTKCNPPTQATSNGQVCPDGSFGNGGQCTRCSSSCLTCTGGTSNDCVICASGLFSLNGQCISADSNGICAGTDLIADNNKHECDTCGASCTKCTLPNFNAASTVDQLQCTACLPGFFLSNAKCVSSCPSGTTVSSQDNLTCIACDSSCSTCAGSSTFCLSCPNSQLASGGKCVQSCPSNTFSSSGACLTCHPDCASCTGGSFNQCTSCPSNRPVLTNGRCLPTCSKSQWFDTVSSTCQPCDSSCASCTGRGSSSCLSCSSSNQVLRGGSCQAANCQGNPNVVPGLGVCLSELVAQTRPSTAPPLPTVTGIDTPTTIVKSGRLEWWQILLMALGCAFIFLVIVWLFRRRQKKKRAQKTAMFTAGVVNRGPTSWRWRLIRWGEKLFGHMRSRKVPMNTDPTIVHLGPLGYQQESERSMLIKMRAAEEATTAYEPTAYNPPVVPQRPPRPSSQEVDMINLIGSYNTPEEPRHTTYYFKQNNRSLGNLNHQRDPRQSISDDSSQFSEPSIYSQMTGAPRRVPDPRQPVKNRDATSRWSAASFDLTELKKKSRSPFWK